MRKKGSDKKSSFGVDLIEGMKLVAAHQRGEIELEQVWPKPVDVKAIRKRVKMSQAEFSRAYGISKRALQEWEQGGRQPDSAARAYLTVIAKEPRVVRRALASEYRHGDIRQPAQGLATQPPPQSNTNRRLMLGVHL